MKGKKTTRRALVMSLLSLLLCCSMLVGTTFAWFTDSVTSGRNKIVAGNLDITLDYWNNGSFAPVTEQVKLFDDNALWEPGHTEIAYLRVDNAGSLALKYQLAVNVYAETPGTNVDNQEFKLSDYLVFKVVNIAETAVGTYNRETAREAAGTTMGLEAYNSGTKTLAADAVPEYVMLVIYMPESVGNEANYKTGTVPPSIEMGVTLVATQFTAESDSFGTDYDAEAVYPALNTQDKADGTELAITAEEVKVTVPADADAGKYTLKVDNKQVETDATGKTTVSFEINLLKDGAKVEPDGTTLYPVEINVGKNLDVSAVTHNGAPVANYHYEPTTGIVSFETASFSPFCVIYKEADGNTVFTPESSEAAEKLEKEEVVAVDENGNEYATITAAVNSGASKLYIKAGADLGSITHLDVNNSLTIYGNGAKISGGERDFAIDIYAPLTNDITVTVFNLHGAAFWGSRTTDKKVTLNMYNCEDLGRIYLNGTTGENNINLINCTANKETLVGDTAVYSNANGKIVIENSSFTGIGCPVNLNHKVAGEQTVTVLNSTFTDCATSGTAAYYAPIRLYNSAEGANQTLTTSGNTFAYSEGKAPINKADVLLNAKHNGVDAVGTIVATVEADATTVSGANVTLTHTVADKAELYAVAAFVNKHSNYEYPYQNETVLLLNDIDLNGEEWTPIGDYRFSANRFCGTFDGNGKTISNFKISKPTAKSDSGKSAYGFFGNLEGTVKNLTLSKASVSGVPKFIGVLVGRFNVGLIENCHVVDSNVTCNNWTIGGLVGQYNDGKISGCSVTNTTVTGYGAVGAIAGVALNAGERTIENCSVKNCAIVQNGSFGGNYDKMFGTVLGAIYSGELTVNLNGCKAEGNTVLGNSSNTLCGFVAEGDKLFIDGYAPIADGLAKDGVKYNVSNANGLATLNAMMANKTAGRDVVVNLTADIDMTGKTWTPVDSHADSAFELAEINGNSHTISNLTVNGQAMFTRFAGFGDVVVKDITFDKATVNSNGNINTAILTVQTYQNVTLDNVDVKNSSITGGYKVAPLIATVYNENPTAITATLKNCDVSNTTVTATQYDFCTTGMVAFVYEGNNDKVEFENCTVTNVKLYAPAVYTSHAWVYVNDADTDDCFNEVDGVTVSGCTFENK